MRWTVIGTSVLAATALSVGALRAQEPQQRPTFSAAARLVPLSVTVRDDKGRPVVGLTREDFEVLSDDVAQPITDFRSEPSAITVALLVDKSGSMKVTTAPSDVTAAAHHLVSWMAPSVDRLGLFAFDTNVTQTGGFTAVSRHSLDGLPALPSFGATSLYDALDATSNAIVGDGAPRRAVVAITDGDDTASIMTANEVAARASAIDVPVYILTVSLPIDHPKTGAADRPTHTKLIELATWTGGEHFVANLPHEASKAARTIVTELRQQYLLAFAPDPRPGWHRLTVRTKQPRTTARARAGYITR